MKKIFCDECSKEINISFMAYETFLIDNKSERSTAVRFSIIGMDYDKDDDDYSDPKNFPIEHLCKKCSMDKVKKMLKIFEKEYEYVKEE